MKSRRRKAKFKDYRCVWHNCAYSSRIELIQLRQDDIQYSSSYDTVEIPIKFQLQESSHCAV